MLGDVGKYGNYFVALIFFVVGLHLLAETIGDVGGFIGNSSLTGRLREWSSCRMILIEQNRLMS